MHAPSSSYFDRSAVLHKKTTKTKCEMAERLADNMLQGTITMQVAVFCVHSEELDCVYEDMRMMLEQASQEMRVMHGSIE